MEKVAIIDRYFWPVNSTVGEVLLLLAEQLSDNNRVYVITQSPVDLKKELKNQSRGNSVHTSVLKNFTNSGSPIWLRIIELLLFTLFAGVKLVIHRPDKVYVETNPPLFTPFIVSLYCKAFRKKYLYHLQDIHPEATNIVTKKNSLLFKILKKIDSKTMGDANAIVTLTQQMSDYIKKRISEYKYKPPIFIVDNASVNFSEKSTINKERGFVFCGNAGRLQRIPLLISSIRQYLDQGGKLTFKFAGGGIFSKELEKLAQAYDQVTYLGLLDGTNAAKLMQNYQYGLMPIEDEVLNFAFPSKSSSYIAAGCKIVAICNRNNSVSDFIDNNNFGYIIEPDINKIVDCFKSIEEANSFTESIILNKDKYKPITQAMNLKKIIEQL